MDVRNSLHDSLVRMSAYLNETKGTVIIIAVTDDTVLREHAVKALKQRLSPEVSLEEFRYDASHISLVEGANGSTRALSGRRAISAVGLETLPRDQQTEAIKLLNRQRNQLGKTDLAVVLWLNRTLLEEVSRNAADFYSWRSETLFIDPPADWNKFESERRSYFQAVRNQNAYVNLQGLAPTRGGHIVQMRMDEIFVPLRARGKATLLERTAKYFHTEWIAERRKMGFEGLFDDYLQLPFEARSENRIWEFAKSEAKWEPPDRTVDISELCRESRAVVLGDPGAGKTTLLRYLAYRIASLESRADAETQEGVPNDITPSLTGRFPLYIRIGEYAQHIERNPDASILDFAVLSCEARQLPLTPELLAHEVSSGSVVFLLDGLDEVSEPAQRQQVAQSIRAFSSDYPFSRILLTSRIVGYRESQLGAYFEEFTINPFEDDEIERFAHKWYSALQMSEGADSLIEAIRANPPIHSLASNPLLLTVISLIHYRGTQLPHRRVELYERAAETLVDQWMNARRVVPEDWDARLAMSVILPAVAWHLHTTTSGGLLEENGLQDVIVKALKENESDLAEEEAQVRASRFRRDISEFSGIFLERGLDSSGRGIYGFLHLTFEEYFAGRRLIDKWQRQGDSVLTPLLHDSRWTESILLAVGHLAAYSQFDATRFVRAILEAGSDYENILHRDLLMAARCLGDDVRVDGVLRRLILSRLISVYFDRNTTTSLRDDLRRAFGWFRNLAAGKEAVELLRGHLSTEDDLLSAAKALGQLGQMAATKNVIQRLLKLLDSGDLFLSEAAGEALGLFGRVGMTDYVIERLLKRLKDDDLMASYAAAYGLSELGPAAAKREVIDELLRVLENADPTLNDDLTQWAAVIALGRMGLEAARDEVIAQLWTYLRTYRGPASEAAPLSLVRVVLARGDKEAAEVLVRDLLELLESGEAECAEAAARVFGELRPKVASEDSIAQLLVLLRSGKSSARSAAALALAAIGKDAATDPVITQLLILATDAEWPVRSAAAEALGQVGQFAANHNALYQLLRLLSDEEWLVRSTAATALGQLGLVTDRVITKLLKRLADDDEIVATSAAEALGRLGEGAATDQVTKRLHDLMYETSAKRRVRYAAAWALANLAGYLPQRAFQSTAFVGLSWFEVFASLAGGSVPDMCDAGYVGLRNLVAKVGTNSNKSSNVELHSSK